ncbi:prepilin-type N-terminal cleavage/methylation domain-containing protein [Lignipirellula cremea]|uniref:Type II secretion system protein H n=1 Tax=Lignipirellula cremea TaxID=2528010 RepID=A0A518E561_9BACT|nr:prepilin-type N-terminal cleavage/methylation domain-containing protein [Lignipirellula cremea]QDU99229.1 hypothetical protein Pla8534_71420 [Lignipirellula cremea]
MLRRAFTLLEILLALAIMVVLAGAATIALEGTLHSQRLSQSADLLRGDWAKARSKAMKTGAIQVFRYELGGSSYRVIPWMEEGAELEASAAASPTRGDNMDPDAVDRGPRLLDGVTFEDAQTAATVRDQRLADDLQSSDGMAAKPLLFYPDGSTSDARLMLANERRQYVVLTLRGLTGVSHSSGVQSVDEVAP